MRVRKRPIIVEALQYKPEDPEKAIQFSNKVFIHHGKLQAITPEGYQEVLPNQWIVKDPEDNIYPVDPEGFKESYESKDTFLKFFTKRTDKEFEAMQFTGSLENIAQILESFSLNKFNTLSDCCLRMAINTTEDTQALLRDYIITDGQYVWSVKESVFNKTYEIIGG